MDHLGVEVENTGLVASATDRFAAAGLVTRVEDQTTCCYAVQDKVWVVGPGGESWEVYTVTGGASAASRRAAGCRIDPLPVRVPHLVRCVLSQPSIQGATPQRLLPREANPDADVVLLICDLQRRHFTTRTRRSTLVVERRWSLPTPRR